MPPITQWSLQTAFVMAMMKTTSTFWGTTTHILKNKSRQILLISKKNSCTFFLMCKMCFCHPIGLIKINNNFKIKHNLASVFILKEFLCKSRIFFLQTNMANIEICPKSANLGATFNLYMISSINRWMSLNTFHNR